MPEPTDEKEKKKVEPKVKYTLHDSDDEENDTVETRKSVKTAEKIYKKRFFINKYDEERYNKLVLDGKISEAEQMFEEPMDKEIGSSDNEAAAKESAKKAKLVKEAEEKKADAKKSPEEKKAEAEAKEAEELDKELKTPKEGEKKEGEKKEGEKKPEAKAEEEFVPPELAAL